MMINGAAAMIVSGFYLIFGVLFFGLLYLAVRFGVSHGMRDAIRNSASSQKAVGPDAT